MGIAAKSPGRVTPTAPPVLVRKHPVSDDIILPTLDGKIYTFLVDYVPPRDWSLREASRHGGMNTYLHEALRRNMIEWQIHQMITMMDRPTATAQSHRLVSDLVKAIWEDETVGTNTQSITFQAFNKVIRGIVRLSNAMKIVDGPDAPAYVMLWFDEKVEPDMTPINALREQSSAMREEVMLSKMALQDSRSQSAKLTDDLASARAELTAKTDEIELLQKQVLFYKIGAGHGAGGVSLKKKEITAYFEKILEDAPILFGQFASTLDGVVGFDRDTNVTLDTFDFIWLFYEEHIKDVYMSDVTTIGGSGISGGAGATPLGGGSGGSSRAVGVVVKREIGADPSAPSAKRRREDGGGRM
jgi:hypothetical protein